VLKIATNTPTFERLEDDIDLDAGAILDGRETLTSMGERIYEALLAAAAGEPTSAERRGTHEFALRRTTYAAMTSPPPTWVEGGR
jgi:altronate dehydratase